MPFILLISFVKRFKYLFIFLGIDFLLNFIQAYYTELTSEEIYLYVTHIRQFRWAYIEMPPLLPMSIQGGVFLLGKTPIGIRFLTILFLLFTKIILAIVLKVKDSKQEQYQFLLLCFSLLILNVIGVYLSEYVFLLFFFSLFLLAYEHLLQQDFHTKYFPLYILSLVGILYSSYWGIFLFLIVIVYTSWHKIYRKKMLIAGCISLLFFLPVINWLHLNQNYVYDFFTDKIGSNLSVRKFIYSILLLLFFQGGLLIWFMSIRSAIKKESLPKSLFEITFIVLVVFTVSIISISPFYSFRLDVYALCSIPLIILLYPCTAYLHRFRYWLKVNFVLFLFLTLCFRMLTRYHERLIKRNKMTLNEKEVSFLHVLIPRANLHFLNAPYLSSLYSFYNNQKVFNIATDDDYISQYEIFNPPYLYLHKDIYFVTDKPRYAQQWDTVFFKNQNVYYKHIIDFIYWKDCQINNIKQLKKDDSLQIEWTLKTPVYLTDADVQKAQFSAYSYAHRTVQKKYHIPHVVVDKLEPHLYKITTAPISIDTLLNLFHELKEQKIGFSVLQNENLYYFNSPIIQATQIGL